MNIFFKIALQRYRNQKKNKFLQRKTFYKHQYAIIGTGNHSITNIYPCLWFLGVPIKTICSGKKKNAVLASQRWTDCTGTDSIEDIINDEFIKGVFVATLPHLQAGITARLLNAGKNVFVEKPVGYSLVELQKVIACEKHDSICQIGLQRRFAPLTKKLQKAIRQPISYDYHFLIGAYPEGDVLYDVFIHPIDFAISLFGSAAIVHAEKVEEKGTITYHLLLHHQNVRGSIKLSTSYSWQSPTDELVVNTASDILKANYPYWLISQSKPKTFLSMPLEKVLPKPLEKTILMNPSFLPVAENNSLNIMGFYPQLEHFVKVVEKGKTDSTCSLKSFLPTYTVLETLKNL